MVKLKQANTILEIFKKDYKNKELIIRFQRRDFIFIKTLPKKN